MGKVIFRFKFHLLKTLLLIKLIFFLALLSFHRRTNVLYIRNKKIQIYTG